jgi:hypothetical protein
MKLGPASSPDFTSVLAAASLFVLTSILCRRGLTRTGKLFLFSHLTTCPSTNAQSVTLEEPQRNPAKTEKTSPSWWLHIQSPLKNPTYTRPHIFSYYIVDKHKTLLLSGSQERGVDLSWVKAELSATGSKSIHGCIYLLTT